MPKERFDALKKVLDEHYEQVTCALVDAEVETGKVSADGFCDIRDAMSFMAQYFESHDEQKLDEMGKSLEKAAISFKKLCFSEKLTNLIKVLDNSGPLLRYAEDDDKNSIDIIRERSNALISEEPNWSSMGWPVVCDIYTESLTEADRLLEALEGNLAVLREREVS